MAAAAGDSFSKQFLEPLLFGCVVWLLFRFLRDTRHWRSSQSPPGPWGLPIIGHLLFMTGAPHKKFTEWSKRYGDIFRIQVGSHSAVVINGMEPIKAILLTQDSVLRRAASGRPMFASMKAINEGHNMLFNDYEVDPNWGAKKRAMIHTLSGFMTQNRTQMEEIVLRKAKCMAEELLEQQDVDPKQLVSVSCIQMMLEMSSRHLVGDDGNPKYKYHTQRICEQFNELAEAPLMALTDIFPWLSVFSKANMRRVQNTSSVVSSAFADLLDENVKSFNAEEPGDLADHFLTATARMPEMKSCQGTEDLRLLSEFLGAFESTSGTILRWAFLICATFPEEQARLHAELQMIGIQEVTWECLKRLPRLQAFLFEVMRFAVTMPLMLPHRTIADCRLGGFDIPKNTLLMFNVWSALRDPEYWEEPERFNPDRFMTDEGCLNHKLLNSFLFFGGGARKCPGQRLGLLANQMTFVNILRRCVISEVPGEQIDLEPCVTFNLAPKPIRLRFRPVTCS